MGHDHLFQFEDDFVETLRCIPMAVRFKLDACGVKLSLRQWSRLTAEERRSLLMQRCMTPLEIATYRNDLIQTLRARTQETATPLSSETTVAWEDASKTPDAIRTFALSAGVVAPSDSEWSALSPLRRFVLLKLSRDNHDNVNFVPALKEFGLYREPSGPLEPSLGGRSSSAGR